MFLRELYTPLKTHIPGSGGGLNQSNARISGDGALFSSRFGDTKIRYKLSYTTPLVADLDKLVWILYAERIDFSAFVNYGTIWDTETNSSTTPGSMDEADFIGAHGYNIDMQFENKGVRFNMGFGIGQVFDEGVESYYKFGFDAFF